jgi:hypothetical protein
MTRQTIAPAPAPRECATAERARDPKIGPLAHRLRDLGYSTTPGGAHAKLLRLRHELQQVASVAVTDGFESELDIYLFDVDEMRVAGLQLQLETDGMLTIERADAEDNHPRVRWFLDPTLEHARQARHATKRSVRAAFEFLRGLRTAHPELTP